MEIDYNKINPLRVAARPGSSLDEFNVYYQAYKHKTGMVKVKMSPRDMRLPSNFHRALAEIRALEYLLANVQILSEGRTGNAVQITLTTRHFKEIMMINQLTRQARGKLLGEARVLKYIQGTKLPLACYEAMSAYMPSVISRYIGTSIVVSDDVKWISPVVSEKNIHYLTTDRVVEHRVDIARIGKISITAHAFARFKQRSKLDSPEVMWEEFLKALRDPATKLTPWSTESLAKYKEEKYSTTDRHYYNSETHWHFIIVEENGSLVLVTCFVLEDKKACQKQLQ